jgi:hypothetical protein
LLALLAAGPVVSPLAAEDASTVERRLADFVGRLASDELEGRGVGTKGLNIAADELAAEFESLGLKTDLIDGGPFQKFTVTAGSDLGQANSLALVGPNGAGGKEQRFDLKLGKDFNPMAIGGSSRFRLPLVYAGYGITGRNEKYDDYADIDVKGKAVIVMRHEPEQNNPHSLFNGTDHSRHAPFRAKVSNAYQHGAAAVIFCTDQAEIDTRVAAAQRRLDTAVEELAKAQGAFRKIESPTREQTEAYRKQLVKLAKDLQKFVQRVENENDPLLDFRRAGLDAEGRDIPVLFCSRASIDQMLAAAGKPDLAALEAKIDEGPAPQSFELSGWQAQGQTDIEREEIEIKNVLAVIEGKGPHADETVILGAHYDHLGLGGPGSAAPGKKEIHNGADDNASGTAVLVEVARQLAQQSEPLARRVLLIAFTGEERGLLGSAHYAAHPVYPLDKTVAMLNMDMVGRLQENKLIVNGTGTAKEFPGMLDELNEAIGFELIKKPSGFGPSDHATFYGKKVPVLHFFTGSHGDYHKPTDDADKLDIQGMRRIGELVTGMVRQVANSDAPPTYQETKQQVVSRGGTRPYFGSIPDFRSEQKGYALSGVAKDSPAERAGIRGGDVVIQFGDSKIGNLEDIDGALRKYKAGDKVPVVVRRDGKEVKLEVTLDPPK